MISKQSVVDRIEVTRSGSVQIRFGLLLVEGGEELDCKWHRTVVDQHVDVTAQLAAVQEHLSVMGYPWITAKDAEKVQKITAAAKELHENA